MGRADERADGEGPEAEGPARAGAWSAVTYHLAAVGGLLPDLPWLLVPFRAAALGLAGLAACGAWAALVRARLRRGEDP